MAAKPTLHVALTEPLLRYIGEQIATGQYATASEVIRAGLGLLIERDVVGELPDGRPGLALEAHRG